MASVLFSEAGASEWGGTQCVQGCPLVLHIKYCGGEYEQFYLYFVTLKTQEFQNDWKKPYT